MQEEAAGDDIYAGIGERQRECIACNQARGQFRWPGTRVRQMPRITVEQCDIGRHMQPVKRPVQCVCATARNFQYVRTPCLRYPRERGGK